MKNVTRKVLASLIMICSFVFVSCDNEEAISTTDNTATKAENITNYLRMVSNDTTLDVDVTWDEMSCEGTVTFTFENTDMVFTAATEEDLSLIFDELYAEGIDVSYEDIIIISVTVIGEDGTEMVLDCEDEIEDYFEDCFIDYDDYEDDYEDEFDDTMECIDIVYPITLHVLNANNGTTNSFTVENDDDLYDILEQLNENDIVEVDYPINLIIDGDVLVTVNNEDELFEVLENAYIDCYEDGDDDDCDDEDDDEDDEDDESDD